MPAAQTDSSASPVLAPVRFFFESAGDTEAHWRVLRTQLHEGISELYLCEIELACEDLAADPDVLVGRTCTLVAERTEVSRRLCGVASRITTLGTAGPHQMIRVQVVPAMWTMCLRRDSYIFQSKSVPDILKEVLTEGLDPYNRKVKFDLQRAYAPREYCVQYQETDLAFVQRLMEEEGIAFFFDFSGDEEELVVTDHLNTFPVVPTLDDAPIELRGPEADSAPVESIRHFHGSQELQTTSVVVRDYDWTRPATELNFAAKGKDATGLEREEYLGVAELTLSGYSGQRYQKEDGKAKAELRQQGHVVHSRSNSGEGLVVGFAAGSKFQLTGHTRPALDGEYLLTRIEHAGSAPEELLAEVDEAGGSQTDNPYVNRFECIPADVPFRPRHSAPRPRISGVQTATVVGPSGEEIHTDDYGRIKVQFHWDRAGKRDDKSSCYVRVAQATAGSGFGFVFLPRIGMEVLVEFIEGNPDRPLVVGCVYNGLNLPPYALPDEKTRSTLRTNSTPGGDGYNELSFEDAGGSEEVYLQAQKNWRILVKNDKNQDVGGHEHLKVKKNRTREIDQNQVLKVVGNDDSSVGGNHGLEVGGDDSFSVGGSQATTVGGNQASGIGGNRGHTVAGNEQLTVGGTYTVAIGSGMTVAVAAELSELVGAAKSVTVGGELSETVGAKASLTVGGNFSETVGGARTLSVGKDLTITAKGLIASTAEKAHSLKAKSFEFEAKESILFKVGDAQLELKKNGDIILKGSKLKLEASGDMILKGSKIKQN